MASPFSHAVAALTFATCFYRSQIPKSGWIAGMLCSVIPDLDVIGFRFGIHYGDFLGTSGIHAFAAFRLGWMQATNPPIIMPNLQSSHRTACRTAPACIERRIFDN